MTRLNFGIFSPFILSLIPIVLIYSNNALEISFESLFFPIIFIFFIIFISIIILRIVIKNLDKISLILSLSVVLFFNVENVRLWLDSLDLGLIQAHHLTLLLYITIFCIGMIFIYKIRDAKKPTKIIVITSAVILISFFPNFIIYSENDMDSMSEFGVGYDLKFNEKPDIYLILLDGYAGNDSLKDDFMFDNSKFLNELQKRDFIVADNIFSNYFWTVFAMSSILNMNYTHDFEEHSTNDQVFYESLFSRNLIMSIFRDNEYETLYIDGGGPWREMYVADEVLCRTTDSRMIQTLIETSAMKFIYGGFTSRSWDEIRECAFNELEEVSQKSDKPKFVYAHIRSPHPPYTIDDAGKFIAFEASNDEKELNERYVNQLKYTNEKINQVLSKLLSFEEKPIIILISDHGMHNKVDFDHKAKEDLIQSHSNFGAYYLPGVSMTDKYKDATPVNVFRLILNDYFEGNFERLEEKAFFIEHNGMRPINDMVYEITDIIDRQ